VVTKDGGDEHHGSVGYWINFDADPGTYPILDLETGTEEETEKRNFLNHDLSITAGGPIIKEKLWYFVALDGGLSDIQFEGMDPDAPYKRQDFGGLGKITFFPTPDLTLQYQFNGQGTHIDNYETSGLYTTEAQAVYNSNDLGHIFTTKWRPHRLTELELKLSYLPSNINVVPASGDEDTPSMYDVNTGQYFNNYDSFDYNRRSRLGASLKATRLIEGFAGDHRIKAGAEFFLLRDSRELVFTGPGEGYQFIIDDTITDTPCPYIDETVNGCTGYTEYVQVGELGHKGNTLGLFLQDDWSPVPWLTANIGVRVDRETLFQNAGDKVIDGWMPAPRLGLAWDVTNDSKTLVSLNAGRYYDIHGNDFAGWADTKNAFVFREFSYDPDNPDANDEGYFMTWEQDPATDPLVYCTGDSLDFWEDYLVEQYGYDEETAAEVIQNADENYCKHPLRPYYLDKIVLGVKRELVENLAIGVRGILSQTKDLPEDIDIDLDTWVIANVGDMKRRDYQGLELTLERQYDGVWSGLVSYTLSTSKSHMPGQFELSSGGQSGSDGNNVGVYLDQIDDPGTRAFYYDVGYGWLVDGLDGLGTTHDDQGYYGLLPYHNTHHVKVNAFYTLPFGTTLGAVYEFDSGHAWQKRGYVELYHEYYAFPEGRGSRFMPATHYIDFRVAHKLDFKNSRSVELMVDFFNLPGFQSPITYYENDNESFGLTMYRQAPRALRIGLKGTY